MPFSTGFLVAFGSLLFLSLPAYAHKLLIEARVDGDRVRFEAYFDDDTPAQDARLLVENAKQEIVAEGKTDERGVWNCPLPAPGKYLVRADLLGHQAKRDLLIGDRAEKQDEGAKPQRNVSHAKPWLEVRF